MNKMFKVITLTLGCLLIASAGFAQYTEFIVEPGGSGTTYPDLATAVATAQAFTGEHRIVVRAGTYNDVGVWIDHTQPGKIREIVGDGKDVVFFEDPVHQTGMFLDVSGATDVTVTGISVVGYVYAMTTQFGPVNDLHVYDCIFDDNGVDGLPGDTGGGFAIHGSDILIEDMEIMNGERGIRFGYKYWDASHANTWVGPVTPLDNITVQNNYIHDNEQYAIYFDGKDATSMVNALVTGNTCENNTDAGIQFWPKVATFTGLEVSGNTVTNSTWEGILVNAATGSQVFGNTVSGCSKGTVGGAGNTNLNPRGGIYMYNCTGGAVYDNTCYDNGDAAIAGSDYGIYATGGGMNIHDNCLFDHLGVEAYDGGDGSDWWHANYYEDLAGTPYVLDGGVEQDNTPWLYDASADGPATVDVFDVFSVDINWTIPGCSELDAQELAAYTFTVSYDDTKLAYVPGSADYDGAFFGTTDDGALYTGIDASTPGQLIFTASNFDMPYIGDGRMAFMEFEAIGTGASQITVGSQYLDGDDPPNTLLVGNTAFDITVEDNTLPSGTVAFNDPIGNMTFSDSYGMEFSGTGSDQYCLSQVYYRVVEGFIGWNLIPWVTNDGTNGTYGPVNVSMAALPEGDYTLEVLFRDCAANDFSVFTPFSVDKTGPDVANLMLTDSDGCADAGFTSSDLVDVAWDNPDGSAVEHEFYTSDVPSWSGAVPIENPTTYTFDGTEGSHSLWVRQYDVYGNMGPQIGPVAIMVDKTAPAPSAAWLVSNPTPAKTNTDMVDGDCNLDAASGALYAKAAEDGVGLGCGDAGWALISGLGSSPRFAFDLSDPDGLKTVTFASMDAAGNVGTTDATITLDAAAAELTAFSVADIGGSECAENWTVAVTVEWTATDVAWLHLGSITGTYNIAIDISAETSPFTTNYVFTSPPRTNNAMNSVFGVIEDDATNTGVEMTDEIYVDRNNPTAGTVVLNGTNFTWTANPVVSVDLSGMSLDANEILMSEISGDYTGAVSEVFDPGTPSTTYDFGTPTENIGIYLYVKLEDCADRQSAEATGGWVAFDLTDPILSDVEINGGAASTNNNVVSVDFTWTELHMQTVYISENADMSAATAYPWAGGPPYSFTVAPGDGIKDVYVQLEDFVGRKSTIETDDIDLDNTVPLAGTLTVYSANPLAIDNHTSVLTGNTYLYVPDDDDIVEVLIRNQDNSPTLGWMPYVDPMAGTLMDLDDPGACTGITVEWYVKDDAGNQTGPFTMDVDYCNVAPAPPPPGATGTPGGSVLLEWTAVTDAQMYHIRYNFSNEYPLYTSGPPPFPTTMGEGIFEAEVATNSYDFEGPQDDLFAFGIWTLSDYGLYSATGNNDVMEHNYRLGDFMDPDENPGSDGCLSYDPEFVFFGAAYNTSPAANPNLDIAPTDDGSSTGIAQPDDAIDFEDFVIFAINYQWSRAQSVCDGQKAGGGAAASLADVIVSAEAPAYTRIGDQFSVPISISEGSGVAGYHLVFDYDATVLEVVSVDPGTVYQGIDKSFFYYDANAAGIDISSVVLNDGGLEAGEIAVVTFRSRITGPVILEDELLDVRDWDNHKANVNFDLAAKGGTLPNEFQLAQNYPNPFNPSTTIELSLPEATSYRLTVYNVIGQVINVFEGYGEAGYVTINWDASQQSSGVYLYRVTAGDFSDTKKMILLK